jgi:hypothetical protein
VRGNAAGCAGASTLCPLNTPGQDGLAALLLLVRGSHVVRTTMATARAWEAGAASPPLARSKSGTRPEPARVLRLKLSPRMPQSRNACHPWM